MIEHLFHVQNGFAPHTYLCFLGIMHPFVLCNRLTSKLVCANFYIEDVSNRSFLASWPIAWNFLLACHRADALASTGATPAIVLICFATVSWPRTLVVWHPIPLRFLLLQFWGRWCSVPIAKVVLWWVSENTGNEWSTNSLTLHIT